MAKLNPLVSFSAAASALTLSTSRKLIRNFNYYRSENDESIGRKNLQQLCKAIRRDSFGLHNLIENEPDHSAFFVALARQIDDQLEELHRKILFFDAEDISEIIPLIDVQRSFWSNHMNPDFYDSELVTILEHRFPASLYEIENQLHRLPESAIL